jgi:hypothetical protein
VPVSQPEPTPTDKIPARDKAWIWLALSTLALYFTHGLSFWSLSSGSSWWCLQFYFWCVVLTGWGLHFWSRKHRVTRQQAWAIMIFGPFALFLVLALLIIGASNHMNKRSPLMNGTRLDGAPAGAILDPNGPYITRGGLRYR